MDGHAKGAGEMFSMITEELIWATIRERREEMRSVHPHTEKRLPEAPPDHPISTPDDRPSWRTFQPSLNG
jgi:hypothetical protein